MSVVDGKWVPEPVHKAALRGAALGGALGAYRAHKTPVSDSYKRKMVATDMAKGATAALVHRAAENAFYRNNPLLDYYDELEENERSRRRRRSRRRTRRTRRRRKSKR